MKQQYTINSYRPTCNVNVVFLAAVPIPVAVRIKTQVCGRLVSGIAGSNPARGMEVYLLCLYAVLSCVGRGLCDGLITRPEESCRVSNSV
jgi:hypothetical protein